MENQHAWEPAPEDGSQIQRETDGSDSHQTEEAAVDYPSLRRTSPIRYHTRAEPTATQGSNSARTIFEKIGSPPRFQKEMEPHSGTLSAELEALRKLLLEHRIQLLVSSPNISDLELYRFMTGEFMNIRINDDGSPLFHCFLYDDYHPDPFFDNEQTAMNRCIRILLDKNLHIHAGIFMDTLILNQYAPMRTREALAIIEAFKDKYDEIVTLELNPGKTTIREQVCEVSGSHATGFIRGNKCLLRAGRWNVRFNQTDQGLWKVASIRIEDVDL